MAYKRVGQLIRDLKLDELEVEDEKIHQRGDKRADKIIEKMMEKTCHFNKRHAKLDKCLQCNKTLEECPIGEDIKQLERIK